MSGRSESPICPNDCKTKSGKKQHMRRLYTQSGKKLKKAGWICPKCKRYMANNIKE
jgi:hypothetical protein